MRKTFISIIAAIFSMFFACSAYAEKAIKHGGSASAKIECLVGGTTFEQKVVLVWGHSPRGPGRGDCNGYITVAGWQKAATAALAGADSGYIKFFLDVSNWTDGKKFKEHTIKWSAKKQKSGVIRLNISGWNKVEDKYHRSATVVKKPKRVQTMAEQEPEVVKLNDYLNDPAPRLVRTQPTTEGGCTIRVKVKCKLVLDVQVTEVQINLH